MTMYGQPALKISVSTASGSAANKDISQYVTEFNGVQIEAINQQSDAFGDSWVEHSYVGVRRISDLTLLGFYDDVAASGPHAIFGQTSDLGADRTVEFDFGASDIVSVPVIVTRYDRMPRRNELTRYSVVLKPRGAPTTAT